MKQSNVPLLVCGFLNTLVLGGMIYGFGFYGNRLKRDFELTQASLDTISSVFFAAGLFAWFPGMIVDRYLSFRIGVVVGGLLTIVNMVFYWLMLRQFVVLSQEILIAALSTMQFIISLTIAMIEAGTYKGILMFSTPSYRALACGLAKGYPGMGAGVFSLVYGTLGSTMNNTTLNYPIMMTFFLLVIIILPTLLDCTLFSGCWHPTLESTSDDTTSLHYNTLVTGYLVLATVLSIAAFGLFFNPMYSGSFIITILLLLVWIGPIISLMFLPKSENISSLLSSGNKTTNNKNDPTKPKSPSDVYKLDELEAPPPVEVDYGLMDKEDEKTGRSSNDSTKSSTDSIIQHFEMESNTVEIDYSLVEKDMKEVESEKYESSPRQFNSLEMMSTATSWYLLFTFSILIGQFMVIVNNIGEMVQAQEFQSYTITPVALALTSVSQALTRVGAGYLAGVKVPSRYDLVLHPPLVIVLACAVAAMGHAVLAIAQQHLCGLLVGASFAAAGFGAAWSLMLITIGDLFGLDNFGSNFLLYDGCSLSIGTVTLAKFVTQSFYQANIEGDSTTCYGQKCFQGTFLVLFGLLLLAMVSGMMVVYSPIYKTVYGRNRN